MLRRTLLASALATPALAVPALLPFAAHGGMLHAPDEGVRPDSGRNESAALQAALRAAARAGRPLLLPRGRYVATALDLPDGCELVGAGARLVQIGTGALLRGQGLSRLRLRGLALEGAEVPGDPVGGLLTLEDCEDVAVEDCRVTGAGTSGMRLVGCAGHVADCTVEGARSYGVYALDSRGLALSGNLVRDCADGGILVHRSAAGADGTLVAGNRVERIGARSGGTGQWGNGVNTYLAHDVKIANNHVADCAFSAVRCHSATDATVTGNTALRSGETAIYAEFSFQGAVIANNMVREAAMGISIANFLQGGRLATCANNVVRDLRDAGPYPAEVAGFGNGIFAEADTAVTGNVIDGAANWGIGLGWGPYLRDVVATGNVVRDAEVAVAVSVVEGAGAAVIANNVLRGRRGAVVGHRWAERATADLVSARSVPDHLTVAGNRT